MITIHCPFSRRNYMSITYWAWESLQGQAHIQYFYSIYSICMWSHYRLLSTDSTTCLGQNSHMSSHGVDNGMFWWLWSCTCPLWASRVKKVSENCAACPVLYDGRRMINHLYAPLHIEGGVAAACEKNSGQQKGEERRQQGGQARRMRMPTTRGGGLRHHHHHRGHHCCCYGCRQHRLPCQLRHYCLWSCSDSGMVQAWVGHFVTPLKRR